MRLAGVFAQTTVNSSGVPGVSKWDTVTSKYLVPTITSTLLNTLCLLYCFTKSSVYMYLKIYVKKTFINHWRLTCMIVFKLVTKSIYKKINMLRMMFTDCIHVTASVSI